MKFRNITDVCLNLSKKIYVVLEKYDKAFQPCIAETMYKKT